MSELKARKTDERQSSTVVVEAEGAEAPVVPCVRMKLKKPKGKKKVAWAADTVDNENMNKKKSKCCCIYEKPREFGESSSESDDDECEHCKGHAERKRKSGPSNKSHLHPIEHRNK